MGNIHPVILHMQLFELFLCESTSISLLLSLPPLIYSNPVFWRKKNIISCLEAYSTLSGVWNFGGGAGRQAGLGIFYHYYCFLLSRQMGASTKLGTSIESNCFLSFTVFVYSFVTGRLHFNRFNEKWPLEPLASSVEMHVIC